LAGWLFGEGYVGFFQPALAEKTPPAKGAAVPASVGRAYAGAELLCRLLVNPHSGLTADERERAMDAVMEFFEQVEKRFEPMYSNAERSAALKRLMASDSGRSAFLTAVAKQRPRSLVLWDGGEVDAQWFAAFDWLQFLAIHVLINDRLDALASLRQLQTLWIDSAPHLTSLESLPQWETLEVLGIWGDRSTDLRPVVSLPRLKELYLGSEGFPHLQPLAALTQLTHLSVMVGEIETLEPLVACVSLEWLDVRDIGDQDLAPLDHLPRLKTVFLPASRQLPPGLAAREAAGELQVMRSGVIADAAS
jgi:hypothetical protein